MYEGQLALVKRQTESQQKLIQQPASGLPLSESNSGTPTVEFLNGIISTQHQKIGELTQKLARYEMIISGVAGNGELEHSYALILIILLPTFLLNIICID